MKLLKKAGATSEIWQVFIRDSSSTTGGGLTGLTNASGSLTAYYHRDTDTTATAISLVTMTVGTFTSSGFKEVDSSNMPGWYQFCPPNAALAAGAKSCAFHLKGATNMAPLPIECQLIAADVDDSVRLGLTALPNAAASAVGGLPVAVDTSGRVDVLKINGTSQTARDIGASVLLSTGTGTGQLDFTSGVVKVNAVQWLGGTIPAVNVTGVPLIDLKYTLGTISPATAGSVRADAVTGSTAQTGDAYARLGAPAGASVSADIAAAKVDTAAVKVKTDFLPSATAGAAGGVFIAGTNAATAITTGLTAHIIGTVDTVTTYTGNTPQTGDAYARLGAPAGASVSADVAATKALLPTALVGGKMDSHVNDIAAAAITATSIAADAITDAKVASDVTIASVTGTVGSVTGLTASDVGAIKAKTDNLPTSPADETLIIAATNSLASAISALSIPSAATVAAAVRDVSNSSPAAGSLGEAVRGADAKAADLQINLGTPVVSVSADIAAAITSIIAGVLRTTMTEGYAAEGAAFTLEQGMFMLEAQLRSRMLVGDSPAVMTSHKLDGTTVAMTYSVDDAMNPTTQERAT